VSRCLPVAAACPAARHQPIQHTVRYRGIISFNSLYLVCGLCLPSQASQTGFLPSSVGCLWLCASELRPFPPCFDVKTLLCSFCACFVHVAAALHRFRRAQVPLNLYAVLPARLEPGSFPWAWPDPHASIPVIATSAAVGHVLACL
jgi:hypothetical protein